MRRDQARNRDSNGPPSIVWFRRDLRLDDHPALQAAVNLGRPIVPVFIWDEEAGGDWRLQGPGRWWLSRSLARLDEDLCQRGSRLIVRKGNPPEALMQLARDVGAGHIFWNQVHEPDAAKAQLDLKARLHAEGIRFQEFNGNYLFNLDAILTGVAKPYTVFTPFWRACLKTGDPFAPQPPPARIPAPAHWPESSNRVDIFAPAPNSNPELHEKLAVFWTPGPQGAEDHLARFLDQALCSYSDDRERPDRPGTSKLSPHLLWGEISPRRLWHTVWERGELDGRPGAAQGAGAFLRQLVWREFAAYLLLHYPQTVDRPLRPAYANFPWVEDEKLLEAWRQGQTGYPLVDAGMRQLLATGWMHNRVRMIVASLLTKNLLIPWQRGSEWFWQTLVDADLANNTLGWQWVAGCGADAAPFYRIFNPVLQGERFDPDGAYVRRWVPQLARLPARWIHKPWLAPDRVLGEAGVRLGREYPNPLVDLRTSRERTLEAYSFIRRKEIVKTP